MRKLALLLLSMSIAGQAGAKMMEWKGTLNLELWQGNDVTFYGSGVATINASAGGAHLDTLRLAGGISGSGVIAVTDPETTGTIKSVLVESARLGTGTLTGISGAPPIGQNEIPIAGRARMCLFVENCASNLPLDLTKNNGRTGMGVGGTVTLGGKGSLRISIAGAPWTLATVTRITQTASGNFKTMSRVGFVHGPASASDSSTAVTSGVLQLIAPQQVSTSGVPGNSSAVALFSTLTLHFIPEPGLLLLLASGVAGLGLLGRGRMKR
jgi:hypothetical protein